MADTLERADLERFERELLRKRAELEVDLARLADDAHAVAEAADASPADRDVAERESDVDLSLASESDVLLRDVDAAVARLRAGAFGRCERCGGGIARERLDLLPWTPFCAACARAAEPAERRGAPPL